MGRGSVGAMPAAGPTTKRATSPLQGRRGAGSESRRAPPPLRRASGKDGDEDLGARVGGVEEVARRDGDLLREGGLVLEEQEILPSERGDEGCPGAGERVVDRRARTT